MDFRYALLGCASSAILTIAAPQPATAQDQSAPGSAANTQEKKNDTGSATTEVVVVGVRKSLDSAQNRKKNSDQILDSIQAQDIGKLPDANIVESLQRVTGVQIQRRYGEGSADVAINGVTATPAVAIRGLTQVAYLVDGHEIYSANGGRNLGIEAFPPDILAGIDVYKNPSSEMIEGGIGGLIDLRTRLPFDQKNQLLYATGRLDYYDLAKKYGGSFSALYSTRWNTAVGEMGFLINPVVSNSAYRQDSLLVQPFMNVKPGELPGAPADARMPTGFQIYDETGTRDRFSLATAYQWQVNSDLLLTVQGLYADYKYRRIGAYFYNKLQGEDPISAPGAVFTYAPDGRVISGAYSNMLFDSSRYDQDLNSTDQNYTANLSWHASDTLTFKFDGQYVRSRYDADMIGLGLSQFDGVYDRSSGSVVYEVPSTSPEKSTVDFDLSGTPIWTVRSPSSITDPNSYHFADVGNYRTRNDSTQKAFRVDVKWQVNNSILESISAGVRFANSNLTMRGLGDTVYTYTTGNQIVWYDNWWLPNGNMYIPYSPSLKYLTMSGPSPNFFNGRTVENLIYPTFTGGSNVLNEMNATFAVFGVTPRSVFYPADINTQSEASQTAYVSAKLFFDIAGVPVDTFVGLRALETRTTSIGYQFPSYLAYDPTNPSDLTPVSAVRSYMSYLPSLNIRAPLTKTLQLRLAYSEAMSRPDFWQMGTNVTLNAPTVKDPVTGRPSGSSGNPFLNPMMSSQYDASLEWYFAKAGSLTGSLFYKDVTGFLASGVVVRNYNGIDYDISTTVNSKSGTIQGLEIAYQQFYDFLPSFLSGLGLQANYTYVDSNVQNPFYVPGSNIPQNVPLEKLSKNSFNLVGLYEKGPYSARIAYNWRSKYLNTTDGSGATGLPQIQAPYASLDASVSYNVTKRISLTLEGVNLNNRMGQTYIGTPTEPLQSTFNDRRLSLIVRAYY